MCHSILFFAFLIYFSFSPSTAYADLAEDIEIATAELSTLKMGAEQAGAFAKKYVHEGRLPPNENPVIRLAYTGVATLTNKLIDKIILDIDSNPRIITKNLYSEELKYLNRELETFKLVLDEVYSRNLLDRRVRNASPMTIVLIVIPIILQTITAFDTLKKWYEDSRFKKALISHLNRLKLTNYLKLPVDIEVCKSRPAALCPMNTLKPFGEKVL